MSQFYAKGTIKLKNVDGVLEPFLPNTKEDCVVDMDSGTSLSTIIENMEDDIEDAANSGGVKVLYEDDNSAIETFVGNQSNESMVTVMEPDTWIITVNTIFKGNSRKTVGIPFYLYADNQPSNITIKVDWGDGNISVFTKDYTSFYNHTYSNDGVYTVKITSSDWANTYMYASSAKPNISYHIANFKFHICSIENPLPKIKGISITSNDTFWWVNNVTNSKPLNSAKYLFYFCSQLQYIPEDLFINNPNITDFSYCFGYCNLKEIPKNLFNNNTNATNFEGCFIGQNDSSSILNNNYNYQLFTTIPTDLFRYNTLATNFKWCFNRCVNLTSIPQDLFRYNTLATTFQACFIYNTSLTSIPTDLFRYNTAVTDFNSCFGYSKISSIPADLFKYNTAVTTFQYCFQNCTALNGFTLHIGSSSVSNASTFVTKKTGVTRSVYVPTGSTTQTTFNNVASSLGLTVVGE